MMNSTSLCVFFLVALLTFSPIVRANCTNSAVYNSCMERGNSMSGLCTSTDYICLCDAVKAISLCYAQCTDDPGTVASANAYSRVVEGSCSLASSQSLTMTTPSARPTTKTTDQTAKPSDTKTVPAPTDAPTATATPSDGVIAIYVNKNIILLLTAPLIAVVIMLL